MLYSIEEVKKVLPEGIKLQIVGGKISGFSIYSSRKFKKSMSCAKYNIPTIWMELISLLEDQSSEELERLKNNIPQIDQSLLYSPTTTRGQKNKATREKNKGEVK